MTQSCCNGSSLGERSTQDKRLSSRVSGVSGRSGRRGLLGAVAGVCATFGVSSVVMAQESQPASLRVNGDGSVKQAGGVEQAAAVPVVRVALFSSGVGYFEHFGKISGSTSTTLRFQTDQINDVLKSLILQDLDGGLVSAVTYPSQDPLGRALRGFQVDLSESPGLADLLQQLRGAELVVTVKGETIAGTILGVETRKRPAGESTLDVSVLNLVTKGGIRSVSIDEATGIALADPTLQAELSKALAAVAGARDSDKKNVTLDLRGEGDRRVRVGYVVETPVWKTSYRLILDDKQSNLQGWAIVENQTDTDWDNIGLSLVSGRPISFTMNLYEPMYLARPEAKLELFEGLRPQTYAESREELQVAASPMVAMDMAPGSAARTRAMPSAGFARGEGMADSEDEKLDATASVASRATAGQIGELFSYTVDGVTIARQSSAMIPIITDPIDVTRVSIYNANTLARYPLSGARLNNSTGKNLLQGPITVLDAGMYAGDAQINNVPPGQSRLISYGIDLDILVDSEKTAQSSNIQTARILGGVLEVSNRNVSSRTYAAQNKSQKSKTLIIESDRLDGWTLVDTPKPAEETPDLYRFEMKLEAGKGGQIVVQQQRVTQQRMAIGRLESDAFVAYANTGAIPPAVREALGRAAKLKQELDGFDRTIAESQQQIEAIAQDQNRVRENLRSIDRDSQLYGRLMKKLDEQETQVDKLRTTIESATRSRDAKRAEFEAYLASLNVG